MKKISFAISKKTNEWKSLLFNQRGAELLEWIGMCVVIIALLGAIITFFSGGGGGTIGSKITTFIENQIEKLSK